jgi:hypothetical protein
MFAVVIRQNYELINLPWRHRRVRQRADQKEEKLMSKLSPLDTALFRHLVRFTPG